MKKEEPLQISCVKWFNLAYPKEILHHSPNGGYRNKRINKNGVQYCPEGSKFKKMGTIDGFPDLFLAKGIFPYNGLFIEMKAEKGKLSENQKEMIKKLEEKFYKCVVCNSFDSFKNEIETYLNK